MKRIIAGCCVLLFCIGMAVSCNAPPDEQTLHQYARAKEMYAQGRFAETTNLLEDAKKFGPALTLRGKAEYFSGDLDKAELSCRRAMRYQPAAFEAKLYLARVLREKGETQDAEKLAFGLLSDNPYDVRALRFASALANQQGRTYEARALLDQAAELSAESAMVLLDRARLHWQAGRSAEALEDLERAQAILPWDTPLVKSIEQLESVIRTGTPAVPNPHREIGEAAQ
jgi:tetratricopeptide (TPR) repeat protein